LSDQNAIRTLRDDVFFWRTLTRAHRSIFQHLEHEVMSATGLPLIALEALYDIGEARDQRLQLYQLATRLGISRSGATRVVDRLEDAGYVNREPSAHDRRGMFATLTPAGEAMLESVREQYADVLHAALVRHQSDEGIVVHTTADYSVGDGRPGLPAWYRVQFTRPEWADPD
jgi:DNA-binding MarR family transcriptional regulator